MDTTTAAFEVRDADGKRVAGYKSNQFMKACGHAMHVGGVVVEPATGVTHASYAKAAR